MCRGVNPEFTVSDAASSGGVLDEQASGIRYTGGERFV